MEQTSVLPKDRGIEGAFRRVPTGARIALYVLVPLVFCGGMLGLGIATQEDPDAAQPDRSPTTTSTTERSTTTEQPTTTASSPPSESGAVSIEVANLRVLPESAADGVLFADGWVLDVEVDNGTDRPVLLALAVVASGQEYAAFFLDLEQGLEVPAGESQRWEAAFGVWPEDGRPTLLRAIDVDTDEVVFEQQL